MKTDAVVKTGQERSMKQASDKSCQSEEKTTSIYVNDTVNKSGNLLQSANSGLMLHDRFEGTSFSLQTSMMSNACLV
jgi:hypothetical protein